MWTAQPDQILAAVERIEPLFLDTPLLRSSSLDRELGLRLLLKDETANPIRSFKGRGATNLLSGMRSDERIVSASAGNFGQGLAWAARARNVALTVFASVAAVPSKIVRMRELGAEVVIEGRDFDEAKQAGAAFASSAGLPFVEDGACAPIAEGAGVIAVELLRDAPSLDAVFVPLGNGALAAGVGAWLRHAAPATRVIAVSASGAPAMARSVRSGVITATEEVDTIADGIAVRVPIPSAVQAVRACVDEVLLVDDIHIRAAMDKVREALGITVEPAGAAGLAAILMDPSRWAGQRVATPLCGGNV